MPPPVVGSSSDDRRAYKTPVDSWIANAVAMTNEGGDMPEADEAHTIEGLLVRTAVLGAVTDYASRMDRREWDL